MENLESIQEDTEIVTPQQEPEVVETDEDPKAKRYLEQLKGRELQAKQATEKADRLEARLITTSIKEVEKDNDYLLSLYDEDSELAEKVAKNFGMSASEAVAKIKASKDGVNIPQTLDKEAIFKEWEERLEQKQALGNANKYFDDIQDTNLKDKAKAQFDKLVGGRKLSASELTEIAEMASLYVQKDLLKSDAKDKAILGLSSTPLGRNNSTTTSKSKVAGAEDLAKAMGLSYLYN